jgi:hypothetical protein
MGEIIDFTGGTYLDIDPQTMLDNTDAELFEHMMIIGVTNDRELYLASNKSSIANICFLLSMAWHEVMNST